MSEILNIGVVPYLNALPLIDGLESRDDLKLHFATPAQLEQDLDAGHLDAALLPVVSLFDRPHLSMFSFAGIASDYESGSVLFFSQGSKLRRVAYDEGSRTSVLLLRILLQERGYFPEWQPMAPDLDRMMSESDGALLIGDNALLARRDPRLEFDLVDRWRKWTNLPFVFAVWAARGTHPRRQDMAKFFTDASIQGMGRLDSLAHRKAGYKGFSAWEILTYFKKNITYRLGKEHLDAIDRFREKLASLPVDRMASPSPKSSDAQPR